ncbi:amidohydrolase family protein [Catalinimonas niigatensis]|uniref:amidohydrolase family protein n=1 Tax=Catalinimonas niigatensis TaxID=1397264 RepID=UPI002665024C|nr:amidohydrolase family protein [Catalinimonas niigatensis]WPP52392.1 amidohydrolase family protein [Catalinimonas niigatensis]
MMTKRIWIAIVCLLSWQLAFAQEDIYPVNDVRDNRPDVYLFQNATIISDYQTTLENASLLIRDGFVEEVGTNINAPQGARVIDLKGKHVYPGLLDLYSSYGLSKIPKSDGFSWGSAEQLEPETQGPFSQNDALKAHYSAGDDFSVRDEDAETYRQNGFGAVLAHKRDGLARGTGALVTLGNEKGNKVVLNPQAAAHYSFEKGSSKQYYPISKMGFIALLRQTYLDAEWYQSANNKDYQDNTLEAWIASQDLPQVFDAPGWMQILRADKLGDEFGVQYIIRGNGDEYQRLQALKAANAPLIVPVTFPEPFDVDDPYDARHIAFEDMKHWELAPANLSLLAQQGIEFAVTADGLKDMKSFWANLRKAVKYGLSEEDALKALTYTPARLIKAENQLGSLKKGAVANFFITSGNMFEEDAVIYENWIQGKMYPLADKDAPDLNGKYALTVGNDRYNMEVSGQAGKQKFKLVNNDTSTIDMEAKMQGEMLTLSFAPEKESEEIIRLSGWMNDQDLKGRGQMANGRWVNWKATYQGPLATEAKTEKKTAEKIKLADLGKVIYPFLPFGNEEPPQARTYLIKNATVWTNEEEGILENADVLVRDGKIAQVGQNLSASGAVEIDGSGQHLTSGVIDEHTHIAASSINDVAAVSAMVRMEDVVESDDINIYRQLSGGVTAAQLLHGSANPVGGQSALLKLRWGQTPDEMLIKGADGYIKFALGENVKRSSNSNSVRYPQTRMGVEQVFVDAFSRAKAYDSEWKAYNALSTKEKAKAVKPRRDLELETMAEILNKERFITCHSYVQSEINMLMKVAEQFDFNVNTFTHILEGYKVADKMAEHGAAASTFADWWGYKFEVRYAIPYNPMLMDMAGVTVAINSDDAEMARRLNQEAAKSVKYGGMPEEDAWKMVTLNPAKMLHLDDRMGSIKVGKDADLVLWTDHPLSIYARAEKTMVDGRIYYDLEEDVKKREMIAQERARLVQKMQDAKKNGSSTRPASREVQQLFHCDDLHFGHLAH